MFKWHDKRFIKIRALVLFTVIAPARRVPGPERGFYLLNKNWYCVRNYSEPIVNHNCTLNSFSIL